MVEREEVKLAHRLKARHAEEILQGAIIRSIPKDAQLHYELAKSIKELQDNMQRKSNRSKSIRTVKTLNDAMTMTNANAMDIKNARNKDYYFDYNTVEQVLIMCSIILSLVAIMFESNQFYTTDPVSGIQVLSTDPETRVYYTVILVMAAITLIGSMVYYFIVFLAEVVGHVPDWVRKLCAGKRSHTQKAIAVGKVGNGGDSDDEIEMAELGNMLFGNPMKELEEAKRKAEDADLRAKHAEDLHAQSNQEQRTMMNQMKKLKQENQRSNLKTNKNRRTANRRPGKNKPKNFSRMIKSAEGKKK
jgi:hypothetical protein